MFEIWDFGVLRDLGFVFERDDSRVKYFSFEREFERVRPGVTREAESCKMDFWVTVQKLEFDSSPFLYICFSRGLEVSARS